METKNCWFTILFCLVTFIQLLNLANGAIICPSATAPCECRQEPLFGGNRIWLNCQTLGLEDSRVGEILDAFLNPNITPLFRLSLQSNKLTVVPSQLRTGQFNQLEYVYFDGNLIDNVPGGAFNFVAKLGQVSLDGNLIGTVEPGAFVGNIGSGSSIYLNSNKMTRFESESFQSVLEQYTNVWIQNSINPIID